MIIQLKKFGTTLISRQSGKEALAAFRPVLAETSKEERTIIDFEGVITFTPSWGDEFLTPLLEEYGLGLALRNTENPSVKATLKILEEVSGNKFQVEK